MGCAREVRRISELLRAQLCEPVRGSAHSRPNSPFREARVCEQASPEAVIVVTCFLSCREIAAAHVDPFIESQFGQPVPFAKPDAVLPSHARDFGMNLAFDQAGGFRCGMPAKCAEESDLRASSGSRCHSRSRMPCSLRTRATSG